MPTQWPDLFNALAAPFPREMVKTRPGGNGITLSYITARTAQNRLDEVLGPERWRPEYEETKEGVKCRLYLQLPDGQWLSKEDGGGFASMKDESDTEKSGYSEAFKRAAAVWGVARYLYRDGVPQYQQARAAPAPPRESSPAPESRGPGNGNGHAEGPPQPAEGVSFYIADLAFRVNDKYLAWCIKEGASNSESSLVKPHQIENYLGTWAVENNRIPSSYIEGPDGKRNRTKLLKMLKGWRAKYPDEFTRLIDEYVDRKAMEKSAELGLFWPINDEVKARGREPGSDG
jgi:hypothetical protein